MEFAYPGLVASLSWLAVASARPGVLDDTQLTELLEWVVRIPERVRQFPIGPVGDRAYMRHKHTATLLSALAGFPAKRTPSRVRERATALLAEAAAYFQSELLAQQDEIRAAEIEGALRSHWRQPDAARMKTQRVVAALSKMAAHEERLLEWQGAAHHWR